MKAVRQKGTTPELAVARVLRKAGLHFRPNSRTLPGSPDLSNQRRRLAIFVHGCYWHHHTGCRYATVPKRNRSFWLEKMAANKRRDRRKVRELQKLGFRVLTVWECETRRPGFEGWLLNRVEGEQ
jgi:DNA mismatch endonuclease (patch repair protein)